MKKVIIFSILLMIALNVVDFINSQQQREAAFAPAWAAANPAPSAGQDSVAAATPIASAAPAPATSTTAPDELTATVAKLQANGLKSDFAAQYLAADRQTGTPWQILAAVHHVETGQSGDTARESYAGAEGPMQFLPSTFSHYGTDGDGNGTADINSVNDAIASAAHYLAVNGAASGNYQGALYHYNHSWSYVDTVLSIAGGLGLN